MTRNVARPCISFLAAALLVSCKDSNSPAPAEPLYPVAASARPGEILQAAIRGTSVPASGITGRFGGSDVSVSRVNDSTVAVVVPALSAASHQLSVAFGAHTFAANVQVGAAVLVVSPQVYFDTTINSIQAATDALTARMLSSATRPPGIDSIAFVAQLNSLRTTLADVKTAWANASPEDRQAVASVLAANASVFGLDGPSASGGAMALESAGGAPADCDRMNPLLVTTNREAKQLWATLAVVGYVSWGASFAGKALGAVVSALIVKKFILAKQEQIWKNLVAPCVAAILDESNGGASGGLLMAGGSDLAAIEPPVFVVGEPRALVVNAEYRSIIASDASAPGPFGAIISLFTEFQGLWRDLVSLIPFLDAPAPQFPATPAKREKSQVPASQLSLGTISPSGVTGTASGTVDWMVRLDKPGMGKDMSVSFGVGFTPPGMPVQNTTRSAVLQPKIYPVATVTVPATALVARGGTQALTATVRDSMDRVMTGATLYWSSDATNIATVNPSTGVVTGVATGTATITTRASGTVKDTARANTTITVVDHKVVIAPKSVSVESGKSQQFTATVTGTTNTAVTWAATGGAISNSGSYTAGTAAGTFRAIATTVQTPARADTATITITAPDSTAIYRAAVIGIWKVSNVVGGGSSSYDAELFDQVTSGSYRLMKYYTPTQPYGNGGVYCPNGPAPVNGRCEYGAGWYITKINGRYYLYDSGFWNGYDGETRDPLTMPVTGFTTYSKYTPGAPSRTFSR